MIPAVARAIAKITSRRRMSDHAAAQAAHTQPKRGTAPVVAPNSVLGRMLGKSQRGPVQLPPKTRRKLAAERDRRRAVVARRRAANKVARRSRRINRMRAR